MNSSLPVPGGIFRLWAGRALMEENPELLRIVPLKRIASYLWITPQSLSRIRARILRKKP